MSRSGWQLPVVGSELSVVQSARDYTVVGTSSVFAAGAILVAIVEYSIFPKGQLLVVACVVPVLVAALRSRHPQIRTGLSLLGLGLIVFSTVFASPTTNARLSASVVTFILASLGAVVWTRPVWQWVLTVAALWMSVTPIVPLYVEVGDRTVNARWLTLLQLVVTTTWLAYAWRREIERVRFRDEIAARQSAKALAAIASRERIRVWRRSLAHIHETVLNDIRSVLDNPAIDWSRLRAQLAARQVEAPPTEAGNTVQDLLNSIAEVGVFTLEVTTDPAPDCAVSDEQASTLRTVLFELVRNLERHAGATRVRITAALDRSGISIALRHDGTNAVPASGSGVGSGVVLKEALPILGARLDVGAEVTTVHLPLITPRNEARRAAITSTWRVVLATGAAGNAVGGAAHYLLAGVAFGAPGVALASSALVVATLAGWAAWRQAPVPIGALLTAVVAATFAPLIVERILVDCATTEFPLAVATLSSIAMVAVVTWAPTARWMFVAILPVLAVSHTAVHAKQVCPYSSTPGLIAASVAPILCSVMAIGLVWSTRRQHEFEIQRRESARTSAAAAAAHDFGSELHAAVHRTMLLLGEVAATEELTSEVRRELRCQDAVIRSGMQVDPEFAGAFATCGRELVKEASDQGTPVRVFTLRDSGDRRALPAVVRATLSRLLLAASDGSGSVQVLAGPGEDTLIVTASHAAATRSGLAAGWRYDFPDGRAEFDHSDPTSPSVLMVRRAAIANPGVA